MLRIKAVVGVSAVKDFSAWETIQEKKARIAKLDENISFAEIGAVFARIAHELKIPNNASAQSVLETIIAHGRFPDGALRFADDAAGTEKNAIYTGCCFGIRYWRKLLEIKPGDYVWLGHSPMPEIECFADNTIKIWVNGDKKSAEDLHFELTRREFRAKVLELENDLIDFTTLLELWAEQTNRETAAELIEKFGYRRSSF